MTARWSTSGSVPIGSTLQLPTISVSPARRNSSWVYRCNSTVRSRSRCPAARQTWYAVRRWLRKREPADEGIRVANGEPRFRLCPPFGEIKWLRVTISTNPPPRARFDRSLLIVIDWHWSPSIDIDCQCSSVLAYDRVTFTPLSRTQQRPVAYP